MHLDPRLHRVRELYDIGKRVEIFRPHDVGGSGLVRHVEVRIPSLSHLDDQRVQVCSMGVGDQFFDLGSRLHSIVEGVHPERAVLRLTKCDWARGRAWRVTTTGVGGAALSLVVHATRDATRRIAPAPRQRAGTAL